MLIRVEGKGKDAGRGLVSIHNIPELKGVSLEEDGTIIIRPATSFSHITNDPIIKKHLSMLGEAVDQVGGPQVRIRPPSEEVSAMGPPLRTLPPPCAP